MKKNKRITIYDLANELGISASYVSRALNDHPSISDKMKMLVKMKAKELNYRHNSNAANLRMGSSRTIGVVVPKINESFFSNVIAGIEATCFEHKHHLIICQSEELFEKEVLAVEKLVRLNVDCIIISLSSQTITFNHLEEVKNNNIQLIQFDRTTDKISSHQIINNNKETAYKVVKHLLQQGYSRIAYIGGPEHTGIYKERKAGYLQALKEADISIPYHFVNDNALTREHGSVIARELLQLKEPPDAIFTTTDYVAFGVLKTAAGLGIKVPEQLGVFGFANEMFAEMLTPGLSSVEQFTQEIGKRAAGFYFEQLASKKTISSSKEVISCELILRGSSLREKR